MAQNESSGKSGRPFPLVPVLVMLTTLLLITTAVLLRSEFESWFGLDPVWCNIYCGMAYMIAALIWTFGFFFASSLSMFVRMLVAVLPFLAVFGFMFVMRPVNSGDGMGIHHFEPIWENRGEPEYALRQRNSESVVFKPARIGDFNQFLGPNRNNIITHLPEIDVEKFETAERLWKQPVGEGWSGFVACDGMAVTMEQRGPGECVTCYNIESGLLCWIHEHQDRHQDGMNLGHAGPRSTPAIDDGHVYALGANGLLVCLKYGNRVWAKDLAEILDVKFNEGVDGDGNKYFYEDSTLAWGHSGSPLIVEDKVIVPGGGSRDGAKKTLFAFDKTNGELIWEAGTDMISYSSPNRTTAGGVDQIVIVAESAAVGYATEDGRQLWSHSRPATSETDANCSQVTIGPDGLLILSKGYGMGGELIELEEDGDELAVNSLWSNNRVLKTKMTNPVYLDDHIYCLSDGFLECTELETGERVWKRRGRFGHGHVLLVGEKLLVHSEYGELFLVEANPEKYVELGRLKTIDGVCWNMVCLSGEYLLVRSDKEAACFRIPFVTPLEEFPIAPGAEPEPESETGANEQ